MSLYIYIHNLNFITSNSSAWFLKRSSSRQESRRFVVEPSRIKKSKGSQRRIILCRVWEGGVYSAVPLVSSVYRTRTVSPWTCLSYSPRFGTGLYACHRRHESRWHVSKRKAHKILTVHIVPRISDSRWRGKKPPVGPPPLLLVIESSPLRHCCRFPPSKLGGVKTHFPCDMVLPVGGKRQYADVLLSFIFLVRHCAMDNS